MFFVLHAGFPGNVFTRQTEEQTMFRSSVGLERAAVNRKVVGSIPTETAF